MTWEILGSLIYFTKFAAICVVWVMPALNSVLVRLILSRIRLLKKSPVVRAMLLCGAWIDGLLLVFGFVFLCVVFLFVFVGVEGVAIIS